MYAIYSYGTRITKSFAGHLVLDQVDLAIERGTVLALLGPNGAGKTTMVRILATLVRPDSGTATIAGHDLLADPIGVKSSISFTGQFAAIDDLLTGAGEPRDDGPAPPPSRAARRGHGPTSCSLASTSSTPATGGWHLLGRHATAPRPRRSA